MGRMARILLTHTPEMFRNYYGERALARLREQGEVRLHRDELPLAGEALVAAAQGCEIVVSDFKTPGDAPVFERSPELVAFLRCAVDIRTIDVAAASRAGVLVTRASAGFVAAVAELAFGRRLPCGARAQARTGPAALRQHARRHRLRRHRQAPRRAGRRARHAGARGRSSRASARGRRDRADGTAPAAGGGGLCFV